MACEFQYLEFSNVEGRLIFGQIQYGYVLHFQEQGEILILVLAPLKQSANIYQD